MRKLEITLKSDGFDKLSVQVGVEQDVIDVIIADILENLAEAAEHKTQPELKKKGN